MKSRMGYPSLKVTQSWLWEVFLRGGGGNITDILHHFVSSPILKSPHAGGAPSLGGHRVLTCPCSPARRGAMPRGRALLWLPPNSIYLLFKALGGSSGSPGGLQRLHGGRG